MSEVDKLLQRAAVLNETDTIVLQGVPYNCVENVWHMLRHDIMAGMDLAHDNPTENELYVSLLNRERQLWLAIAKSDSSIVGTMITKIYYTARSGSTLLIEHVNGRRMMEWKELISYMQLYAEASGCKGIEFCDVRNGAWVRAIGDTGYKPVRTLYRKEL